MEAVLTRIRTLAALVRPWHRDAVVVVLLVAVSLVEIATADDLDEPWVARAAVVACVLALLARRRAPLVVAHVIAAVLVAASALGTPPESIGVLLAVVVAAYTAAAERLVRPVVGAAASLCAGIAFSILRDPTDSAWNIPPTLLLFVAIPVGAGITLRGRARAEARAALAEERARIARELHDVVAHGVSLIALQADAASAALDHDPPRAREPIEAIGVAARDALAELRRLLEVVRAPDDDDPRSPRPRAADLPELVARARQAGLRVELRIEGTVVGLPAGVDLTVYRVAQEALTNALRHSGMAEVAVTVRYRAGEVEIEVVDDGRPLPVSSEGLGLVGMRERVGLYGGRVSAGPPPNGGYRVLASVPW